MLQQIVTHTPFHIWLLLAVLVWRGIAASRDRTVPLRQVFVLPLVLLALSVQDMAGRFGIDGLPAAGWLAAALAATLFAWRGTAPAQPGTAPGSVQQRGSWLPLALMLATFATKYAVAVACTITPELAGNTLFATAACTLYGVYNGLFAGRALRSVPWASQRRALQA
jgi:hypothetical protein